VWFDRRYYKPRTKNKGTKSNEIKMHLEQCSVPCLLKGTTELVTVALLVHDVVNGCEMQAQWYGGCGAISLIHSLVLHANTYTSKMSNRPILALPKP
jgi:hypothetical protein